MFEKEDAQLFEQAGVWSTASALSRTGFVVVAAGRPAGVGMPICGLFELVGEGRRCGISAWAPGVENAS